MMKLVTLLENSTIRSDLGARHGISIYLETDHTIILFDTGPDGTFLENAIRLGIDLAKVDYLVISHGHADHGGGIEVFQSVNQKATILLKESALTPCYSKLFPGFKREIGLCADKIDRSRCQFISGSYQIDNYARIITNFQKPGFIPGGNRSLFTLDKSGKLVHDEFDHEICLLVNSGEKNVLITGCSHSGLANMIGSVQEQTGINSIETVVGGFHLYNPVNRKTEPKENIDRLISELDKLNVAKYFTGHCTGRKAYRYLNSAMGNKVSKFNTGTELEL